MRIQGDNIYLKMLERKDCKTLWNDYEYDFNNPTEEFNIGHSDEKAEKWFDEIQNLQGNTNVRLGIFLANDIVIGDIALQDIDRINRNCSIGIGIAKIVNRSKGYGGEAVRLMLIWAWSAYMRILWILTQGHRECLKKMGYAWKVLNEKLSILTERCMTDCIMLS